MKLFWFFNIVLSIVHLIAILCPFINPEKFSFFSSFGVFFNWILFFQIFFVFFWLLAKKEKLWLPLLAIVCSIPGIQRHMSFSSFATSDDCLSIMSYNIGGLTTWNLRENAGKKALAEMVDNVENIKMDIICFQESNTVSFKALSAIPDYFDHHKEGTGPAIFSKFPILNRGILKFRSGVNSCLWADVQIDSNRIIRVFNVHLSSSKISKDADDLISGQADQNGQALNSGIGILKKYTSSAKERATEAQKIQDLVIESPYPSLICGDFNETPQSYVYRILKKGYTDTFREKGKGMGVSYLGKIPLLRIDYVLVPEVWKVCTHEVLPWKYSDHAPVTAEFAIE